MPDAKKIPTLLVTGITQRAVANDGDFGLLMVKDRTGAELQILTPHHLIEAMGTEFEDLHRVVSEARRNNGKASRPTAFVAKPVNGVTAFVDKPSHSLVVQLSHPNGTSTRLQLSEADLSILVDELGKKQQELAQTERVKPT